MNSIEKIWSAAKLAEAAIGDMDNSGEGIGRQDVDLARAARDLASRLEMHSDGCGTNPNWRYLERIAGLANGLLDQVHAITDDAVDAMKQAQSSLGFIAEEARAVAEQITADANARPEEYPPVEGAPV